MPTLPERLRQAAQYIGLDSMRELLIEAAGALESAEPSGWIDEFGNFEHAFKNWMDEEGGWKPLYTATQSQERKPLTNARIASISVDVSCGVGWLQMARAIEAAHGIKD